MVTLPYHEDRMHDISAPAWRQVLDQHHTNLVDDLTAHINAEIAANVARSVALEREKTAGDIARALAEEHARADAETAQAVAEERSRVAADVERALITHKAQAEAETARAVEEERKRAAAEVERMRGEHRARLEAEAANAVDAERQRAAPDLARRLADERARAIAEERGRSAAEAASALDTERQRAAADMARRLEDERTRAIAEERTRVADEAGNVVAEQKRQAQEEIARVVEQERRRAAADLAKMLAGERARAVEEERTRAAEEAARAVDQARKQMGGTGVSKPEEDARRRRAEAVNQSLRRIRQTSATHETLQLILDDSAQYSQRAVVVMVENNHARVAAWRSAALRQEEEDIAPFELREATSLKACVESRDPVVAVAAPGEVSSVLARALSTAGSDRIYLFPIVVRQNTVAVLLACGEVNPTQVEMLCEAAGMRLEALDGRSATDDSAATPRARTAAPAASRPAAAPVSATRPAAPAAEPFVQISSPRPAPTESPRRVESALPVPPKSESVAAAPVPVKSESRPAETPVAPATTPPASALEATEWSKLSPDEQTLHVKAQRTARVRVAQMRISESEALRKGVQSGTIYRALRSSIDAAREEFRRAHMTQTPTMVDYLHLEMVRSLARGESRLLGSDYPGPLV